MLGHRLYHHIHEHVSAFICEALEPVLRLPAPTVPVHQLHVLVEHDAVLGECAHGEGVRVATDDHEAVLGAARLPRQHRLTPLPRGTLLRRG